MTVTRGSIDTRMFNAINEKTKQIWFQTGNSPTGEQGIHLAGGTNAPFDTSTPNTWGYNTFITNGGLKLRYNQIDLTTLSTNALTFYKPNVTSGTISGSVKAMELGTSALTFYSPSSTDNNNLKKLMELTTSSLNFYDKDDNTNPIAQYNGSGVLLGKESVNNGYNTLINSNGLTIRQNINGTQKNLAQFYGTGFAFTNTNNNNIISGGSVPSSQVYQYIYNERTINGTVPAGQTNYVLYIKFPEFTGGNNFYEIAISTLQITVGSQGDVDYQCHYNIEDSWANFSNINVQLQAYWNNTDKMPTLMVRFINHANQDYTIQFLKADASDEPPEDIPAYYIAYNKPSSANFIIGTQGRLPSHATGTGMVCYNSNGSNAISEWVIDAAGNTFIKDLYLKNHSGPIGTLTRKIKNTTPHFSWSGASDKWVNDTEPQLYLTPGTYIITASARMDTGSGNSGKFGICIGYSTSNGGWARDIDSRVVRYNNQTYMMLTTTIGVSVDTSAFFSPFYYSSNNNSVTVTYQAIRAVRVC